MTSRPYNSSYNSFLLDHWDGDLQAYLEYLLALGHPHSSRYDTTGENNPDKAAKFEKGTLWSAKHHLSFRGNVLSRPTRNTVQ